MSGGGEENWVEALGLRRGHLTYLPVAAGRMEFAAEVRKAILKWRPAVVAVELPGWLERHYRAAVGRLPAMSVIVYPEDEESERGVYVVVEPADPFVEALRTGMEVGAEIVWLEPDAVDRPHLPESYPDTWALRKTGYERYVEAYRVHRQGRPVEAGEHAAAMAWRLQGTDPERETLAVVSLNLLEAVLEAMEQPQEAPRRAKARQADLVNPHPECLAQIAAETPFLQGEYELWRPALGPEEYADRRLSQFRLLKEAGRNYEAQTGEQVAHWQRRMMARYTRNLAMIDSQLVANLFDVTTAARAVVDDNFAWEVWQAANAYPWQQEHDGLETVNLSAEEVFLRSRKLRLRRRRSREKRRLMPRGLKPHAREKREGEWAEQVGGAAICSYPPEDLIIEDYGKLLRRKAKSLLSEERSRVEPFRTSVEDGIDLRETIRQWHEGRIYVKKLERLTGDVGAVVVIFDEDREQRYSYLTTWQGEHSNESDMAFYSTPPFEHMVGPGIGRAEYGGLLMALPPRRMYDVWGDPDYDFAETKAERLLLAALDYSLERHVVYVAARPPRTIFRSIAAHLGRQIVYVPVGQLSPAKLKRIRVVHVLDGYDRRNGAERYIW